MTGKAHKQRDTKCGACPTYCHLLYPNLERAEAKLMELFRGMVEHNGISRLQVDVKPLKKGRKNVVLSSGKDFHFVLKPIQAPAEKGNPGPPNGEASN